jgi:hypothetical protein
MAASFGDRLAGRPEMQAAQVARFVARLAVSLARPTRSVDRNHKRG